MQAEKSIALYPMFLKEKPLVFFIITVSMFLRIVLGLLNHDANDNHVDIVNLIVATGNIPEKNDCWSCYQPKLYYLACAGFAKILNITTTAMRIALMQLVNVCTSFFILLLFWKFIDEQKLSYRSKCVVLSFFAFNPCLIGINIQGTNDTPVIFFGILAVYACQRFFSKMKMKAALVLIIAIVAGLLTKASALVIAASVSLFFVIKIISETAIPERIKQAKYFFLLSISVLVIVPFAGGYYSNYKKYGNFTLSTWEKDPPPYFFKKTYMIDKRPGLENMFEGFFTFRYFDMIRKPYVNNVWLDYPMHRTSLWSQIYGRTMFLHFDQWPPSWQSLNPFIIWVGRILLLLGIVPLLLFVVGILRGVLGLIRKILERDRFFFAHDSNYFYLLVTLLFLASSVFYTYHFRDFSSMKSIYIFPGLLAFIKMFTDGFVWVGSKVKLVNVEIVLLLIVILQITDVSFLIYQLY